MRLKANNSSKLVRMSRSLLGVIAAGSLILFVGASRPAEFRKVKLPTMPRPTRTISILPVATISADAELLHEAEPAAAVLKPSTEKRSHVLRMEVTAYCACTKCCGPNAQGITASGLHVSHNNGRFVAADTDVLAMYSKVIVPGYDREPVPVIDRGGAIKGYKLDLYFPTHEEALQWGRQWVDVTVIE
jgi:3D (Asp-Asp-Asp) domain-containing protein